MKVKTGSIDFTNKMLFADAINYVNQTLSDVGSMYIDIQWNMGASKGQEFHHSWSAEKFIEAITSILNTSIDLPTADTKSLTIDEMPKHEQWNKGV